ncbi:MAG: B-box zinc finger protein [Planctomycetota bacterium]|nr:B-box zinc finger protein [Planctomycetota bacterium]
MENENPAQCENHEDRDASAVCELCQSDLCEDCTFDVVDHKVCKACSEVDGRSYRELYRHNAWGSPDGFVTAVAAFPFVVGAMFIAGSLLIGLLGLLQFMSPGGIQWANYKTYFLIFVVGVFFVTIPKLYLAGVKWARYIILLLPALLLGMTYYFYSEEEDPKYLHFFLTWSFSYVALIVIAHFNPRTKLAFSIPLSDASLESCYRRSLKNYVAIASPVLALLSFAFPPLMLLSGALAVSGLANTRSKWPQVPWRVFALFGLILTFVSFIWMFKFLFGL